MNCTVGALVALLCASSAFAQDQVEQKKAPATKLEAFQSRTGVVLIRGYSTVGSIHGFGGDVTVDAREFRDGSNPNSPRATGVSITVRETGRLERENTSYIDLDELDSLLKGIEYISKVKKDVTKLAQFEVDYRTKGDLCITVFNSERGDVSAVVSSGTIGRTRAFIKLADLEKLRELIATAKSML
jgi:hypothetical protein